MKRCCKCKVEKPESAFNRRNKYELHAECKECFNMYYKKNKKDYIERHRRYKEKNRLNIFEYLKAHSCSRCGESDPRCLEFHHLRDKEYNISRMIANNISWEKILLEIRKCEVTCANCHRKETSDSQNWYKTSLI